MLSLNNYIIESKIENVLLDRLCLHCYAECLLTFGKGLYPINIYESLGKFNNASKVLEHILNELKNNFSSQLINCKNDNVFFDSIQIEIIEDNNFYAAYDFIKDNVVNIEIYCKNEETFNDNIEEYEILILHELLHAYEDYNRNINNKPDIFQLWNIDYEKSYLNMNNFDKIKRYISRCKYFLNPQERNAYFSSLESSIKKVIKDYHISVDNLDYEKFKHGIKREYIWEIYFDLGKFILSLDNIDEKRKNEIVKQYNSLYNTEKSFNEIKKELNNQWKKFDNKFNQLVPKILCKNIQIKEFKNYSFSLNKLNESFIL